MKKLTLHRIPLSGARVITVCRTRKTGRGADNSMAEISGRVVMMSESKIETIAEAVAGMSGVVWVDAIGLGGEGVRIEN